MLNLFGCKSSFKFLSNYRCGQIPKWYSNGMNRLLFFITEELSFPEAKLWPSSKSVSKNSQIFLTVKNYQLEKWKVTKTLTQKRDPPKLCWTNERKRVKTVKCDEWNEVSDVAVLKARRIPILHHHVTTSLSLFFFPLQEITQTDDFDGTLISMTSKLEWNTKPKAQI